MYCVSCQKEISDGSKFCNYCGSKQDLICDGCGANLSSDSIFCNQCGQKVGELPAVEKAVSAPSAKEWKYEDLCQCP